MRVQHLIRRRALRLVAPALLLFWAFGLTALERHRMRATALRPSISQSPSLVDAAALAADVRALSAPSMEGRLTGSAGSHRAQDYILEAFSRSGLQPITGAFAQKFAFTHHSIKGLLTPGRQYTTIYPDATNLIGALPGSSASNTWIVVSAHYDHLGIRGGVLYPGADDNASGVATMLAAAAYFHAHRPRLSMLF